MLIISISSERLFLIVLPANMCFITKQECVSSHAVCSGWGASGSRSELQQRKKGFQLHNAVLVPGTCDGHV